MPLANLPQVFVNGTSYTPAWDTDAAPAQIVNGSRSMGPADIRYWRWVAQVDSDCRQVFTLRVAGPDAPDPGSAIVLAVGRHPVEVVFEETGERQVLDGGHITVRAS